MKLATHRKHDDRFDLAIEVPYADEQELLALVAIGAQTAGSETAFEPSIPAQVDEETGELAPASEDGVATLCFQWLSAPEGIKQKEWIDMQRREAKLLIEGALARAEPQDAGTKVQGEGEEL